MGRVVILFAAVALAVVVGWHALHQSPAADVQQTHVPSTVAEPPAAPASAYAAVPPVVAAKPAPTASLAYRATLIRTARAVWGMDAPVAVFAAQVHQESLWNPSAVSHVGAQGLAQFMPGTTTWIATVDSSLANPDPFNPAWAIRAMVIYDQWLYARAPTRYTPRDRMWVSLRSYNGGLGHWQKEAAASGAAQPTREQVDAACGKARRAASHCRENLQYPARILNTHQPLYLPWGPGL